MIRAGVRARSDDGAPDSRLLVRRDVTRDADAGAPATRRHRLARIAAAVAVAAAVVFVCWPGVRGFWGRDDYMQLAFARMIGSLWPLFVHDHFPPAPGSIFRPLGFASLWLGAALFGTDYGAHALGDIALHAAVALALFSLLRRAAVPLAPTVAGTLLFALHPAVVGTATWWSARFDLLATLFILLSLRFAFAYRARPRAGPLAAVALCALGAMLSKEVGLAVAVPLALLWLRWAGRERARRTQALRAFALTVAVVVAYFAWRGAVLGTATTGLGGGVVFLDAVVRGGAAWIAQAGGYFSFWTRLGTLQRILVVASAVPVCAMAAFALARVRALPSRHADLALCGACLLVLPALLQAPVAALNAAPLASEMSAVEAAMQSRLYYLGIAGAAAALAALLASAWERTAAWQRGVVLAALLVGVGTFAVSARDGAHAFAQRSMAISDVAREAVAAVGQAPLPRTNCHVVFLGVEPPPEWGIYVSMDSIVKALSPDLDRVGRCHFHADYPTFFNLQAAPADAREALPYEPLRVATKTFAWLHVGKLVVAYLAAPRAAPSTTVGMRFLRWHDGRFSDVTAEVAQGVLTPVLR